MSRSTVSLTSDQLLQRVLNVANLLCGTTDFDTGSNQQNAQVTGEIIQEQPAADGISKPGSVRFEVK